MAASSFRERHLNISRDFPSIKNHLLFAKPNKAQVRELDMTNQGSVRFVRVMMPAHMYQNEPKVPVIFWGLKEEIAVYEEPLESTLETHLKECVSLKPDWKKAPIAIKRLFKQHLVTEKQVSVFFLLPPFFCCVSPFSRH